MDTILYLRFLCCAHAPIFWLPEASHYSRCMYSSHTPSPKKKMFFPQIRPCLKILFTNSVIPAHGILNALLILGINQSNSPVLMRKV